ncbi:hypothetical protein MSL71_40210 [Desulfoluna butyratoxydans]|uniref:Uncharacterized protein n=1 Tax=Desulfoluna butyratoxydans TaxID=231438 RepID=A0A4U8YS80_9BACT|nr:hypothetical protein MSL71_40210 [Desulfoluna butyratoxydans]
MMNPKHAALRPFVPSSDGGYSFISQVISGAPLKAAAGPVLRSHLKNKRDFQPLCIHTYSKKSPSNYKNSGQSSRRMAPSRGCRKACYPPDATRQQGRSPFHPAGGEIFSGGRPGARAPVTKASPSRFPASASRRTRYELPTPPPAAPTPKKNPHPTACRYQKQIARRCRAHPKPSTHWHSSCLFLPTATDQGETHAV